MEDDPACAPFEPLSWAASCPPEPGDPPALGSPRPASPPRDRGSSVASAASSNVESASGPGHSPIGTKGWRIVESKVADMVRAVSKVDELERRLALVQARMEELSHQQEADTKSREAAAERSKQVAMAERTEVKELCQALCARVEAFAMSLKSECAARMKLEEQVARQLDQLRSGVSARLEGGPGGSSLSSKLEAEERQWYLVGRQEQTTTPPEALPPPRREDFMETAMAETVTHVSPVSTRRSSRGSTWEEKLDTELQVLRAARIGMEEQEKVRERLLLQVNKAVEECRPPAAGPSQAEPRPVPATASRGASVTTSAPGTPDAPAARRVVAMRVVPGSPRGSAPKGGPVLAGGSPSRVMLTTRSSPRLVHPAGGSVSLQAAPEARSPARSPPRSSSPILRRPPWQAAGVAVAQPSLAAAAAAASAQPLLAAASAQPLQSSRGSLGGQLPSHGVLVPFAAGGGGDAVATRRDSPP